LQLFQGAPAGLLKGQIEKVESLQDTAIFIPSSTGEEL